MGNFKGLNYWKTNAEEDYRQVPISVLRYISELENHIERSKAPEMLEMLEESVINLKILRDQIDFESKVNNRFEELQPVISNWIERQEKLIKEATEL
jgi:hypothetical protein